MKSVRLRFRSFQRRFSMHRAISLLLSVVVLAHALVGCCGHHAHAAEPGTTSCSAHAHPHAMECQHAVSLETASVGQDQNLAVAAEHSRNTCGEASCIYLRGDAPLTVELSQLLAVDSALLLGTSAAQIELNALFRAEPDSQRLAPPTRLHLLHQILLI